MPTAERGFTNVHGFSRELELTVGSDGRLSIPSPVAMELGLEPGVLLSLQPVGGSLRLASYREFLADSLDAVTGPTRWHFLTEFLSRPLVAVEPGGRIAIPPEVFPLRSGDRVVLQSFNRGLVHELYLIREDAAP